MAACVIMCRGRARCHWRYWNVWQCPLCLLLATTHGRTNDSGFRSRGGTAATRAMAAELYCEVWRLYCELPGRWHIHGASERVWARAPVQPPRMQPCPSALPAASRRILHSALSCIGLAAPTPVRHPATEPGLTAWLASSVKTPSAPSSRAAGCCRRAAHRSRSRIQITKEPLPHPVLYPGLTRPQPGLPATSPPSRSSPPRRPFHARGLWTPITQRQPSHLAF